MEDYDCECGGILEVFVQLIDADVNKPWLCQCNKCMRIVLAYECGTKIWGSSLLTGKKNSKH